MSRSDQRQGAVKEKMVKLNDPSYKHDIMERFRVLIYGIKAGQKLGDDHINAVNQILHDQFEDFRDCPLLFWVRSYCFKNNMHKNIM